MNKSILFDGIDMATGRPTISAISPSALGRKILSRQQDAMWRPATKDEDKETERGVPKDWALVCRPDLDPEIRDRLNPLIMKRNGRVLPYTGELDTITWAKNLNDVGVDAPESNMYLLLIGSPKDIPFDFEKILTPQHAVGRLYLPNADAYSRYVQTLLTYEDDDTSTGICRRHVEFFATDDTPATLSSTEKLVKPLMQSVINLKAEKYQVVSRLGDEATLIGVLDRFRSYKDAGAPAITFLASHGAEVSGELRPAYQGSWVPQGAPALGREALPKEAREHYLTGEAFASGELSPHGSILFNFSCFGAGLHQEFTLRNLILEDTIEPDDPNPLVSSLSHWLLSNDRPALAYISTLDRTSNVFSLLPNGIRPFRKMISLILKGTQIGIACQLFWEESATLMQGANQLLESAIQSGEKPETLPKKEAEALGLNWTMAYELDNFVIEGDPAAQLHQI